MLFCCGWQLLKSISIKKLLHLTTAADSILKTDIRQMLGILKKAGLLCIANKLTGKYSYWFLLY